jgi:hypothetical protein
MPKFQLFPGSTGVDLDGGGSIKADHHGRITVSDAVAERIRGSSALRRYDAIIEIPPSRGQASSDDRMCPDCGRRTLWTWQQRCGRCEERRTTEAMEASL